MTRLVTVSVRLRNRPRQHRGRGLGLPEQKAGKAGDVFKIKGGYLDGKPLTAEQVIALADLPTMPVLRAKLLGLFSAPASKLVHTLAEPARQMAAVLKAHADQPVSTAG